MDAWAMPERRWSAGSTHSRESVRNPVSSGFPRARGAWIAASAVALSENLTQPEIDRSGAGTALLGSLKPGSRIEGLPPFD